MALYPLSSSLTFYFVPPLLVTSTPECTDRGAEQGRRTALTRARSGDWVGGRIGLKGRAASRPLYSGTRSDDEPIICGNKSGTCESLFIFDRKSKTHKF